MLRWTRHLVSSFLCVPASWRHSESAAAAARASAQPYPTRQRTTSPDGSAAQAETSLACRPASARQVESARVWLSESSCCWYAVAARSASVCFQLCCSTRHCAAPFASIVIALHSRTSAAFRAADLPQASRPSVSAAVNRLLVQRVHGVQRVHRVRRVRRIGPPRAGGWGGVGENAPHSSEPSPSCARAETAGPLSPRGPRRHFHQVSRSTKRRRSLGT